MNIVRASLKDLDQLTILFDAYRVFYKQMSDLSSVRIFLEARFKLQDSVLFLALSDSNEPMGFTQLYPTFSSVSMESFYILNDLYVTREYRNQAVGESLLNAAKKYCREEHAKGLTLETAVDNPAQRLYERLGWKKEEGFLHYFWKTDAI